MDLYMTHNQMWKFYHCVALLCKAIQYNGLFSVGHTKGTFQAVYYTQDQGGFWTTHLKNTGVGTVRPM